MATAEELLSAYENTDKTLVVDNDLRIIKIPAGVPNLGVVSDDEVLELNFRMPRYIGNIDLSTFGIRINYYNANNEGDLYTVNNPTINPDTIEFSWLVGPTATKVQGNTKFNICAVKLDSDGYVIKEFNTTPATLSVLEGLEANQKAVSVYTDVIEQWRQELFGSGNNGGVKTVNGIAPDENGNVQIEVSGGNVDLSNYYTKGEVDDLIPEVDYPVTSVNGQTGAVQIDIPAVPTKVSAFENDKSYATETFVTTKIAEAQLSGEEVDLSGYATKDEIPEKVSELENDSGYLTEHQSLAGYAKTTDHYTKTESDGKYQPKGNYLTAVPGEYVTETELEDKGYLTEHQSLEDYAKKTDIPTTLPASDVKAWAKAENKPTYTASEVGALPSTTKIPGKTSELTNDSGFITSYTETDPTVPAWAKAASKPSYSKSEVGLGNVDNVKQYSASNPPPYPVTSVNGKTGAVSLDAAAVGARPSTWTPTASDVGAATPAQVNAKYTKPSTGIPKSDLASAVQASLGKADTALQSHQSLAAYSTTEKADAKYQPKGNYLTEHQDISGLAEKFDPTVYGLPILYLTGDTSPIAVSKDNKVTLSYVYGDRSGSCTLKGQGATSYKTAQALVNAGKKGKFNYTIKFDNAFEAKEGWGAQQKYCLKANFIDTTHSRNIVSCTLWGMSVKARSSVPSQLANLPNGGAIDGFPIIIMLNGEFHGLYTWNIPKDGWMFGLVEDTAKTQAIVGADDHTTATQFKEASMTGFEVEFVSDEDNAAWVETSLTRLISAVMNSNGSDLDTTVAQYLDWDSAIDHYIHTVVDKATDCVDKNYLLVTFDGVKWYMSAYDRDSIHGLNWDASGTTRPVSNVNFIECAETVRIYELIKRFKTNALKARYKELRGNILSESRIMEKFENFAWAIPSPVKLEDVKLYPTIMGSGVNTIDQIGRFVRQRLVRCDEWIDALPAQETPSGGSTTTTYAITNALSNCVSSNNASTITEGAAYGATITANDGYTLDGATVSVSMGGADITETAYSNGVIAIASVTGAVVITISAVKKASGYTNLVPTSTDTDGSIYNGTGYKENVRLSSSGSISGNALTGSVTTGFIPCKADDVIRMKGATWLGNESSHLYYINFYNSAKTYLTGYTAASYSGSFAGVTVEHDQTTGITMWDTSTGPSDYLYKMKDAAYCRINAYGKGADLIITVNQEITE